MLDSLPRRRLALLAISLASLSLLPPGSEGADWRLVMLPDTQGYTTSEERAEYFEAQTAWIAANVASERIEFVTHVGDVVEHGASGEDLNQVEWDRATLALARLDSAPEDLPYSIVPGNHDYDLPAFKGLATQFTAHFGAQRYEDRSWFIGASAEETSFAQRLVVDGRAFLALGLEWNASDDALLWAQGVLDANPGLPTLVTTHQYLALQSRPRRATGGDTPNGGGDNSGESVYRKLVETNPQIFLVLCGHQVGDGRLDSTTSLGERVHQVLSNYQADSNGGNGWMQLVELREADREIEFETFSPTYVPGVTPGPDRSLNPASNFVLPFDFPAHRGRLRDRVVRRFRAGMTGPTAALPKPMDTHVGDGSDGVTRPDLPHGQLDTLRVAGEGDREQALIAFPGFVGLAVGQVPPGVKVERAILTLTTEGDGAASSTGARLHALQMPWDENATWDSLDGGVQPGPEASPNAHLDVTGFVDTPGTDSFDVTLDVQSWVDGQANHGWVALANGADRWEVRSSEWPVVMERPMLTVVYSMDPRESASFCDSAPNSVGTGAHIGYSGSTSVSLNDLVLEAHALPPNQSALFFYGPEQTQIPLGNGHLCIAPGAAGLFRLDPPAPSSPAGTLQRPLDLEAAPADSGPGAIEAGSTWHVQLWYRDPAAGGASFNLSDALTLVFTP